MSCQAILTAGNLSNVDVSQLPEHTVEEYRECLSLRAFHSRSGVAVFLGVLILLGCGGNLLVLWVYWVETQISVSRIFILNLAICDLITSSMGLPMQIALFRWLYNVNSHWFCKTLYIVTILPAESSSSIMVAVAVDRFHRIIWPHKKHLNAHQTIVLNIILTAVVCIVFASFIPMYTKVTFPSPIEGVDVKMCFMKELRNQRTQSLGLFSRVLGLFFLGNITIMVTMYLVIGIKLWCQARGRQRSVCCRKCCPCCQVYTAKDRRRATMKTIKERSQATTGTTTKGRASTRWSKCVGTPTHDKEKEAKKAASKDLQIEERRCETTSVKQTSYLGRPICVNNNFDNETVSTSSDKEKDRSSCSLPEGGSTKAGNSPAEVEALSTLPFFMSFDALYFVSTTLRRTETGSLGHGSINDGREIPESKMQDQQSQPLEDRDVKDHRNLLLVDQKVKDHHGQPLEDQNVREREGNGSRPLETGTHEVFLTTTPVVQAEDTKLSVLGTVVHHTDVVPHTIQKRQGPTLVLATTPQTMTQNKHYLSPFLKDQNKFQDELLSSVTIDSERSLTSEIQRQKAKEETDNVRDKLSHLAKIAKAKYNHRQQIRTRTTSMMAVVTACYILNWMPHLIVRRSDLNTPNIQCKNFTDCSMIRSFALMSYYLNSAVNAFVYSIFSHAFRKSCRRLFTKYYSRRTTGNVSVKQTKRE